MQCGAGQRIVRLTKMGADELIELFKNGGEEGLDVVEVGVDRRLLLNRKRQLKMYRIWLQGRWRKPVSSVVTANARSGMLARMTRTLMARFNWMYRMLLSLLYRR